jgi:sterol desaturase/sphingolipid hydroxylase (fatty acid hydroxylase superfamily)
MAQSSFNHSDVPIRLFESDAMEFFTHVHPAVVVVIWAPVAVFFLAQAVVDRPAGMGMAYIPVGFLLGLLVWTLIEYSLHRFVFHFPARSPRLQRLVYLFHGIHHQQPQCKTRLVMPPVVSIPLALLFYGLFQLLVDELLGLPQWLGPLFSGFVVGYLGYDLIHYAVHHFRMNRGFLKSLKRHHMLHHFKTPGQRFGVSSPLWDIVFGTKPADNSL